MNININIEDVNQLLDAIDFRLIEKYVRKKKLDKCNNKTTTLNLKQQSPSHLAKVINKSNNMTTYNKII